MPQIQDSEFEALIGREERSLRSFLIALVGDVHHADDLYQSTCLELWRIRGTFEPGTDFGAWARAAARFQVLRHWKRNRREKLVFSSEAMEHIADAYGIDADGSREAERQRALESCLGGLPEESRELLRERYSGGISIRRLAKTTGLTEGGLKMRLLRIRRRLADCVRAKLSKETAPHEG